MHELLCTIGLHCYEDPYMIITKRQVPTEWHNIEVLDYYVKKKCKICGKVKFIVAVKDSF